MEIFLKTRTAGLVLLTTNWFKKTNKQNPPLRWKFYTEHWQKPYLNQTPPFLSVCSQMLLELHVEDFLLAATNAKFRLHDFQSRRIAPQCTHTHDLLPCDWESRSHFQFRLRGCWQGAHTPHDPSPAETKSRSGVCATFDHGSTQSVTGNDEQKSQLCTLQPADPLNLAETVLLIPFPVWQPRRLHKKIKAATRSET